MRNAFELKQIFFYSQIFSCILHQHSYLRSMKCENKDAGNFQCSMDVFLVYSLYRQLMSLRAMDQMHFLLFDRITFHFLCWSTQLLYYPPHASYVKYSSEVKTQNDSTTKIHHRFLHSPSTANPLHLPHIVSHLNLCF